MSADIALFAKYMTCDKMLRPGVSCWAVASMSESFLEEGVVGFVVSIITTHTTIIPSLHSLVIQSFQDVFQVLRSIIEYSDECQDVLCEVSPSWDENHPSMSIPTTRRIIFKRKNVEMKWRSEENFLRNVFEIFSYPYRKKWGWSWFIRKLHATVVRSSYCWATVVEWSLSRAIFRLCISQCGRCDGLSDNLGWGRRSARQYESLFSWYWPNIWKQNHVTWTSL